MKKLTTQITKDNKIITIFAMVDDKTAEILENLDEETRHNYIVGEHEIYLNERKETRRHQSINVSLENGHDFEDDELSLEENFIEKEKYLKLHKAISCLSKEQQWLINEVYFKGRSQVEIAKQIGICKSAISHKLERILKKIKKFF